MIRSCCLSRLLSALVTLVHLAMLERLYRRPFGP